MRSRRSHDRSAHASTLARATLMAAILLASSLGAARALPTPPKGTKVPAIKLPDLAGALVDPDLLAGRPLVLVFGELDHAGTISACGQLLDAIEDPRLADHAVLPVLIVATSAPAEELQERAARGRYPPLILHDPSRAAFGAHRIVVVPTVEVIDANGTLIHAMPGFASRFKQILTQAMLTAAGIAEPDALERIIDPNRATDSPDPVTTRASRMTRLADRLAAHGLSELAEARYREALDIQPSYAPASIGLAALLTREGRLEEAATLYRAAMTATPESLDAALGLAEVAVRQGHADAADRLDRILEQHPRQPRAHYLRAMVHEGSAQWQQAAAHYRTAAELLMGDRDAP